jgi:hypothetical protein
MGSWRRLPLVDSSGGARYCVETGRVAVAREPRRGDDFELYQFRTTVDPECRAPPLRSVVGGLDDRVEHHPAPRFPPHDLPAVARRLRSCAPSATSCTASGPRCAPTPAGSRS